MKYRVLIIVMCLVLSACDDGTNYAPVADATIEPIPESGMHKVHQGESLYEIAWRYGMDYRALAARNSIQSPYSIYTGQKIALRNRGVRLQSSPLSTESKEPNYSVSQWIWPVRGKVIKSFSELNKGVNIGGVTGQPIYATAAGKVVYAGDGLRGYGNLIIIKHNALYLSAYAHSNAVFVREGEWVRQGQKIAEMGNTGSDTVMLHFEIRLAGKPIDPIALIKR